MPHVHLRLGLVLAVTGMVALLHYALGGTHPISRRAELIVALVLLVAGVPLVILGVLKRS
jgi:hypothetical protein